jgi:cytosine deaminase
VVPPLAACESAVNFLLVITAEGSLNMYDMVLRSVLLNNKTVDIAIAQGIIQKIEDGIPEKGKEEFAATGMMASPPYIESHVHLDTALTAGEPKWNESGTLFEGIQTWALRKQSLTREDVIRRASTILRWQAVQGILHVRTHVDITDPSMTALKAMVEVKEQFKDLVDVQIVAFPQEGILSFPDGEKLMKEALEIGADAIGGIPHYEYTRDLGAESIKIIFDLAEKNNKKIDIHCDEIDDPNSRNLEIVAYEAIKRGMGKLVTASHTTAMGSYDNAYAFKLMDFLKKSEINIVSNPLVSITLQGRLDTYPKRRGVTRVKELWRNGINVSFGCDDIMDPWYSFGTGSMLQPAQMAVHICQMTGREEAIACFDMVTANAARTLGIEDGYGLEPGKPADVVLLDAADKWDAIRRMAQTVLVLKKGRVVARNTCAKYNLLDEPISFKK